MSNKIRVNVYSDVDFAGTKEFDQDVIKIGKLQSSNLHLENCCHKLCNYIMLLLYLLKPYLDLLRYYKRENF